MLSKHGHVGFHAQKQDGLWYAGIAVPVGKLTAAQMRGVAAIAERFGSGSIRLTVWQNLLVTGIPTADIEPVKAAIVELGLAWQVSALRAGLVACTGNRGCKFSASDTKSHALAIADFVEDRMRVDAPVNVHLTGCHHSCAQHYIGDIGLLAAKVHVGDDEAVEGYHVLVGGGYGDEQAIAREVFRDVKAADAPEVVARMLSVWMARRASPTESFLAFANRHGPEQLQALFGAPLKAVA